MSGGSRSTTTRTEPWAEQKPYLETGFKRAEDLYTTGKLTPEYYSDTAVAGFGGYYAVLPFVNHGHSLKMIFKIL